MGGVEPNLSSAPAKPRHGQASHVGLAAGLGPGDRGIEVGCHLAVRHLGDDRHDIVDVGELCDVAFAGEQGRRHGEVPLLGKAAAEILDVFVHAEDFVDDQDRGKWPARSGHGPISGDLSIGNRDLHFADRQTVAVGRDGLRGDRPHGKREAGRQTGDHEGAPRDVRGRHETLNVRIAAIHGAMSRLEWERLQPIPPRQFGQLALHAIKWI